MSTTWSFDTNRITPPDYAEYRDVMHEQQTAEQYPILLRYSAKPQLPELWNTPLITIEQPDFFLQKNGEVRLHL